MRVSTNVYQQSLVASIIAAHGEADAQRIVEGWASNAELLNNDVLVIEAVADGLCEVGVANHYYLGRKLEENDGEYPVRLMWANQADRGVHVNVSGGGVTRSRQAARVRPAVPRVVGDGRPGRARRQQPRVPGEPRRSAGELITTAFGTDFVRDPLDAAVYGALNADAVRLMDEAGYR